MPALLALPVFDSGLDGTLNPCSSATEAKRGNHFAYDLVAGSQLGCVRWNAAVVPRSRHCLWNHYTHHPVNERLTPVSFSDPYHIPQ